MRKQIFCSFCSLPQKVYSKKHIGILEVLAFSGVAAILTYLLWQDFHWLGAVIFMALATLAELIYQLRWRQSIKCRSCGFDPIVYKRNPDIAASVVKAFLEKRKEDPLYLLKPQPQIKPIIKKVKNFKLPDPHL